jgi:hypothetical protein
MERQENTQLPRERRGSLVKIGLGEIGGKALSFPFLETLLDLKALSAEIAPHEVRIPETWVLATGIFDAFVENNNLSRCVSNLTDHDTRTAFLRGTFPKDVQNCLREYISSHNKPIAIRSSALTEDASAHPAAGLYTTFMIPNNGTEETLQALEDAIKLVYASLFSKEAQQYLKQHKIPHDNEKMAVILEEVVGSAHGDVFLPLISGVAQSLNFFPVGDIRPEDGAATIAFGLGRKIVDGHAGMRFCPRYPTVRPQFRTYHDIITGTQEDFDAVDLTKVGLRLHGEETETLISRPIENGPEELLNAICSVIDPETDMLRDCPTITKGPRVLTYNRFLKSEIFPLPRIITRLLDAAQYGFGSPVEIEFAMTLDKIDGQTRGILYLLQGRAMPAMQNEQRIEIPDVPVDRIILGTDRAMGHGSSDHIKHLIFVDPADFSFQMSTECAHEIAELNDQLSQKGEHYILMGPGRWGSCNPAVGVPISYPLVSNAKLIAELSTNQMRVEPSQGSHFFHNVVSGGLYYLTVDDDKGGLINLTWMRAQKNISATKWARHLFLPDGMSIRVNGKTRQALMFIPQSGEVSH